MGQPCTPQSELPVTVVSYVQHGLAGSTTRSTSLCPPQGEPHLRRGFRHARISQPCMPCPIHPGRRKGPTGGDRLGPRFKLPRVFSLHCDRRRQKTKIDIDLPRPCHQRGVSCDATLMTWVAAEAVCSCSINEGMHASHCGANQRSCTWRPSHVAGSFDKTLCPETPIEIDMFTSEIKRREAS